MFKIVRFLTEGFAWLQIVACPTLAAIIIGGVIYGIRKDKIGFAIALSIGLLGLITGIFWATKIWKKEGTITFMSKVNGTPELDKVEKD